MTNPATRTLVTVSFASVDLTGTLEHEDERRDLMLVTDEGFEDISANLSRHGYIAPSGHVYIPDWSERSGLAADMQARGLVEIVDSVCVGPFSSLAYLVKVTA